MLTCTLSPNLFEVEVAIQSGGDKDAKIGMRVQGNRVNEVFIGSPAEEAGLQAGDVIEAWDGEAITPAFTLQQVPKRLRQ